MRKLLKKLNIRMNLLLFVLALCGISTAVFGWTLSLVVREIINVFVEGMPDNGGILTWGIITVVMLPISLLLGYIGKKMIYMQNANMKNQILQKVLKIDLEHYTQKRTNFVTNVTQDIQSFSALIDDAVPDFFETIAITVIMLVTAAYFSPSILLLSLACSAIFGVTIILAKRTEACEKNLQQDGEVATSLLLEYKKGIAIFHLFSGGKKYINYYRTRQKNIHGETLKKARLNALFQLLGWGSNVVREMGVLLLGPLVAGLDLGTTVALVNISSYINGAMVSLASTVISYKRTAVAVERLEQVLEAPSENVSEEGATHSLKSELQLNKISFSYENGRGVHEVDACFKASEIAGICGAIGSGKSTISKILIGVYESDKGLVMFDSQKVNMMDLRKSTAYVDQNAMLFTGTILENITAFQEPDLLKAEKAARKVSLLPWIQEQENGFNTPIDGNNVALSGGQRQKLAIARALYKDVDVLVFDEPASALDKETVEQFTELLQTLALTKTVIVVSHQKQIFKNVSQLFHMQDGALAVTS